MTPNTPLWLTIELAVLFIASPAYLLVRVVGEGGGAGGGGWVFPGLWALATLCLVLLLRDPDFDRGRLRRFASVGRESIRILVVFLVLGGLLTTATAVLSPETWLNLPRSRPVLWAVIMVAYPLLSVYPQELIWRAFFFHRYRLLFPGRWAMILASSLAFGYVHVLFLSPLAVVLTVVGGVLFAWTYERTGSILASSIEHALYGCLIFTIGLGEHFYAGPYVG